MRAPYTCAHAAVRRTPLLVRSLPHAQAQRKWAAVDADRDRGAAALAQLRAELVDTAALMAALRAEPPSAVAGQGPGSPHGYHVQGSPEQQQHAAWHAWQWQGPGQQSPQPQPQWQHAAGWPASSPGPGVPGDGSGAATQSQPRANPSSPRTGTWLLAGHLTRQMIAINTNNTMINDNDKRPPAPPSPDLSRHAVVQPDRGGDSNGCSGAGAARGAGAAAGRAARRGGAAGRGGGGGGGRGCARGRLGGARGATAARGGGFVGLCGDAGCDAGYERHASLCVVEVCLALVWRGVWSGQAPVANTPLIPPDDPTGGGGAASRATAAWSRGGCSIPTSCSRTEGGPHGLHTLSAARHASRAPPPIRNPSKPLSHPTSSHPQPLQTPLTPHLLPPPTPTPGGSGRRARCLGRLGAAAEGRAGGSPRGLPRRGGGGAGGRGARGSYGDGRAAAACVRAGL